MFINVLSRGEWHTVTHDLYRSPVTYPPVTRALQGSCQLLFDTNELLVVSHERVVVSHLTPSLYTPSTEVPLSYRTIIIFRAGKCRLVTVMTALLFWREKGILTRVCDRTRQGRAFSRSRRRRKLLPLAVTPWLTTSKRRGTSWPLLSHTSPQSRRQNDVCCSHTEHSQHCCQSVDVHPVVF